MPYSRLLTAPMRRCPRKHSFPTATQPADCHRVNLPPESPPKFFGDFFEKVNTDHAPVDLRKNKSLLATAQSTRSVANGSRHSKVLFLSHVASLNYASSLPLGLRNSPPTDTEHPLVCPPLLKKQLAEKPQRYDHLLSKRYLFYNNAAKRQSQILQINIKGVNLNKYSLDHNENNNYRAWQPGKKI